MTRAFVSGVILHFKLMSRSVFDVIGVTIWPIVYATIAYYMFGVNSDPKLLFSVSLGATVMAMWSSVASGAGGALEFQRWLGTLELLVASPIPFICILAPITIATAAVGIYALGATLLWGRVLFGIEFAVENPALFALSVPAAVVSIGMLGLILATLLVLYRAGVFLGNSLELPGTLATGLLVPIAVLPGWVEPISWILAPTWGIRAMRESALGGTPLDDIAMCLVLSVAYAVVAMTGLRVFERMARQRGTLSLA